MSVDAIDFLPPALPIGAPPMLGDAKAAQNLPGTSSFGQWFSGQMGAIDGQLEHADKQLQSLATGQAQNLHQVMIDLEEARLSFQMLLQVRNRALEAYQDVMRMQI